MRTVIDGGTIVNEGRSFQGAILIDDDHIAEITEGTDTPRGSYDKHVDATGCFILPGVIDEHVHFREPGLTRKADIQSESRAAVYGGVTTFFDMPNTVPQTTTPEALEDKFRRAATESHVNYSFFYGATNTNVDTFRTLDTTRVPGIKLFMGASTGNMLVDRREALERIFKTCAELHLPLMTHCEDTNIINANMARAREQFGDDADIRLHPVIRSEEACWKSSKLAVELAQKYGTRLHIAHISTEKELALLTPNSNYCMEAFSPSPHRAGVPEGRGEAVVTGEACLAHLWFSLTDYETLGARIKCNPSVKSFLDQQALRKALADGTIYTVATDHAPHELKDKEGGCLKATSGMPMVQFSLVTMLELVDQEVLTMERLVELMCHNPARLFSVSQRGFLRPGYKADVAIIKKGGPWTVTKDCIQSKCGWSPMEGQKYQWHVALTMCNGHVVYNHLGATEQFDGQYRGEAVQFKKRS